MCCFLCRRCVSHTRAHTRTRTHTHGHTHTHYRIQSTAMTERDFVLQKKECQFTVTCTEVLGSNTRRAATKIQDLWQVTSYCKSQGMSAKSTARQIWLCCKARPITGGGGVIYDNMATGETKRQRNPTNRNRTIFTEQDVSGSVPVESKRSQMERNKVGIKRGIKINVGVLFKRNVFIRTLLSNNSQVFVCGPADIFESNALVSRCFANASI